MAIAVRIIATWFASLLLDPSLEPSAFAQILQNRLNLIIIQIQL
jgi:hypothetical protein